MLISILFSQSNKRKTKENKGNEKGGEGKNNSSYSFFYSYFSIIINQIKKSNKKQRGCFSFFINQKKKGYGGYLSASFTSAFSSSQTN